MYSLTLDYLENDGIAEGPKQINKHGYQLKFPAIKHCTRGWEKSG